MSDFPRDGSSFILESIDRTAYRWAKYKPDGARQMGKPGRWQKQIWSGDYPRWENCEEPTGYLSSPFEDGPISAALKAASAPPAPARDGVEPTRDVIDNWLEANCGNGVPFAEATDQKTMLHGLAYILRQIEGTNRYMVNIGQTGPATSALRMALDHFAIAALSQPKETGK